jgi:predicted RecB family nuclease
MSLEALSRRDDGTEVIPVTADDWELWISATRTRNYVLGEPLLDWLELYGTAAGFNRDSDLSTFDPRTDYTAFIFEQGRLFEEAVTAHLESLAEMETIAAGPDDIRSLEAAERTFEAMTRGVPIIRQGVLRNAEEMTYGAPDFLVRSDVLLKLFPDAISAEEAHRRADDLGGEWHYRVVDAKFTTLHFTAGGLLANSGSAPAYKVQLHTYNGALGRIQGLEPDAAYLLGRGWEQTNSSIKTRGFSSLERLAPVTASSTLQRRRSIEAAADEARVWIRELRQAGSHWSPLPQPSRPELYPNFTNQQDAPWHGAKRQIAEQIEDLTLLWQVGLPGRAKGHAAGVLRWTDPRCTPGLLGVTGEVYSPILSSLLEINRSDEGPDVRPSRITAAKEVWRAEPRLEFYVDFETVSDLADDFSTFPQRGGQPLIFMVGCGHMEDGEWRFVCFQADDLTEGSEGKIIDEWLDHMDAVRRRIAPGDVEPLVIHWSPAEVSNFETSYNSAKERHPDNDWPTPNWFDFLNRVVKAEPIVIRGAMSFGLKAVAKALHGHGLIETLWGDGPADGLGAMIGAWWCYGESKRAGRPVQEIDLMRQIADYNEVDCRVMMEAVRYFRSHH